MPYTEHGQLPNARSVSTGHQSVTHELIFEDGAAAHSAGFESLVQGWIIRSDGSVEFSGDMIIGPPGQVSVYSARDDGSYVQIGADTLTPDILFVTGDDADQEPYIAASSDATNTFMTVSSGRQGALDSMSVLTLTDRTTAEAVSGLLTAVGDLWLVSQDSGGDVALGVNSSPIVIVSEAGMRSKYSTDAYPRVWQVDGSGHTPAGTGAYESDATKFDKDLGTTHPVSLTFHAFFSVAQTVNATPRHARVRLRWSTDGGSSWTNGNVFRFDGLNSSTQARANMVAAGAIDNVTPTGNVQIEMQYYVTSTDVTFSQSMLHVTAVGDS